MRSKFRAGFHQIPHAAKVAKGGEDACFVDDELLMVNDGVGGWNRQGVDPGLFARELCQNIRTVCKLRGSKSLKQNLTDAVSKTKNIGSCTSIFAMIDENKPYLVKACNMGDSGLLIVRVKDVGKLEVIYASESQQHEFNFPYQVGTEGDSPEISQEMTIQLQQDDIIVMGSDGLFDNMFQSEILHILAKEVDTLSNLYYPYEAAKKLAQAAHEHSIDPFFRSPFSKEARLNGAIWAEGGK